MLDISARQQNSQSANTNLRIYGRDEKSFASTLRRLAEGFSPTAADLLNCESKSIRQSQGR
ncbi:MAG: hypothetical protein LBU34_04165 [Planctomycetaceae bacterium]|nr:hypothetical protein [Planctomycetaceae bacterium]